MQKVLLPTIDFSPARGGVARYLAAIEKSLPSVDVDVLESFGSLPHLIGYIRKQKNYDEIWTSHVLPLGTALSLETKPYVVFLHGLDFDLARRSAWKRFLTKRILRKARKVVANSQALADEVAAFTKRNDILVVYPCVTDEYVEASRKIRKGVQTRTVQDLMKLATQAAANLSGVSVGAKLKQPNDPLKLITLSRLVERKGHLKVINALEHLKEGTTYTIVGDGPMLSELKRVVHEKNLEGVVTFMTAVPDAEIPSFLTSHDVFVMPVTKSLKDREGFGIAMAEAGLFGLPVITTKSPGVDELVEDGVTGFLVDDTPEALDDALHAVEANPSLRLKLGSKARERILARFTRAQMADALRALIW